MERLETHPRKHSHSKLYRLKWTLSIFRKSFLVEIILSIQSHNCWHKWFLQNFVNHPNFRHCGTSRHFPLVVKHMTEVLVSSPCKQSGECVILSTSSEVILNFWKIPFIIHYFYQNITTAPDPQEKHSWLIAKAFVIIFLASGCHTWYKTILSRWPKYASKCCFYWWPQIVIKSGGENG